MTLCDHTSKYLIRDQPEDHMPPPKHAPRDPKTGQLLPGAVLNPAGRPRSGLALSERIRRKLDAATMDEMIDVALDIALGRPMYRDMEWIRENMKRRAAGEPPLPAPDHGPAEFPGITEQLKAMEWLATWARFEKTPIQVEGGAAGSFDVSGLSDTELAQIAAVRAKLLPSG